MAIARLINVSNWDGFLQELRDFLVATGDWTVSLAATGDVVSGGTAFTATTGDCLVGLRSTSLGLGVNRLYMFDGIPPRASEPPDVLPGNSGIVVVNYDTSTENGRVMQPPFAGPFPTVTLFTNDPSTYCHCVVEVLAGVFRHIYFGNLTKFGTWTGGGYYGMTYWSQSIVQIDIPSSQGHGTPFDGNIFGVKGWTLHFEDAGANWRAASDTALNGVARKKASGSVRGGFGNAFRNIQDTPWSGLIALNPVTLWVVETADTPETARACGQVPDMAEINMRQLVPGESYFIGADEWVVFPLARKANPAVPLDVTNSGYFGMAFLVR